MEKWASGSCAVESQGLETMSGITQTLCHVLLKTLSIVPDSMVQSHGGLCETIDCLCIWLCKVPSEDAIPGCREPSSLFLFQYYGNGNDTAAGSLTLTLSACSHHFIYIN